MKKISALLISILFTASSCEKAANRQTMQVLQLNLVDDPVALDPRMVRSLKDLTLVKQLFEGLMRLDAGGTPQPAIAEKVTLSEDDLTYTFHLRTTSWSNLEPLTAFDFEYAWKEALDPQFASDYAYMLYPIKNAQCAREGKCSPDLVGVSALDDQTLVVQLRAPTPYFLELVAFPTYFPTHQKDGEDLSVVCNGPFCLKEWLPQQKITLIKNPSYWDKQAVSLDQIVFSIIPDNHTESYLFEKEELDWLGPPMSNTIFTEVANKMRKEGKLNSYPIAGTYWFKFNTLKSPFHLVKVRKAFSYALNRHDIILHILQGDQSPATGPLPPSMSLHHGPYFEDGNPVAAKELLEQALQENGWTRETFPKIILNYPPNDGHTKIAAYVQQQWSQVLGIDVELQSVENQLYLRNSCEGRYQVGSGEWIADYNDPLAFLELFKECSDAVTGDGMNDTHWHNPTFCSLLESSLTERDLDRRKQLLHQAEQILVEEMPIAPLFHYTRDYVKKPYVKDVLLSPLGIVDFKTTRIDQNKGTKSQRHKAN